RAPAGDLPEPQLRRTELERRGFERTLLRQDPARRLELLDRLGRTRTVARQPDPRVRSSGLEPRPQATLDHVDALRRHRDTDPVRAPRPQIALRLHVDPLRRARRALFGVPRIGALDPEDHVGTIELTPTPRHAL